MKRHGDFVMPGCRPRNLYGAAAGHHIYSGNSNSLFTLPIPLHHLLDTFPGKGVIELFYNPLRRIPFIHQMPNRPTIGKILCKIRQCLIEIPVLHFRSPSISLLYALQIYLYLIL